MCERYFAGEKPEGTAPNALQAPRAARLIDNRSPDGRPVRGRVAVVGLAALSTLPLHFEDRGELRDDLQALLVGSASAPPGFDHDHFGSMHRPTSPPNRYS